GYFDKFPDKENGNKFKIGDYRDIGYAADKKDPTRFTMSYDGKDAGKLDNFVQWVLKRPEYKDLVDSVRDSVRERIRDVAVLANLEDKIRTVKDAIVSLVTRGEKADPGTLKALEILEARRAERIQKLTAEDKLLELARRLANPDAKGTADPKAAGKKDPAGP